MHFVSTWDKRLVSKPVVFVILFLLAGVTNAQPPDELAKVFQAWKSRAEAVPCFHYELGGTQTIKAHSRYGYDDSGMEIPGVTYPANDVRSPFYRNSYLDPIRNLYRVEADATTTQGDGSVFKWPHAINMYDGHTTLIQLDNEKQAANGALPQVEYQVNGTFDNFCPHFSWVDQSLCFAHGHFLSHHQFGYRTEVLTEDLLRNTLSFRVLAGLTENSECIYELTDRRSSDIGTKYIFECDCDDSFLIKRIQVFSGDKIVTDTSLKYSGADASAPVRAGTVKRYDHMILTGTLTDVIDFEATKFEPALDGFDSSIYTASLPTGAYCYDFQTNRNFKYYPATLKWHQSGRFWVVCVTALVLIALVWRRHWTSIKFS